MTTLVGLSDTRAVNEHRDDYHLVTSTHTSTQIRIHKGRHKHTQTIMSLLRTTATRSLAVNTVAPFGAARFYAEGPGGANSTTSSGGASSTGFKNREQGEETKYIMQAEAEKLQRRECCEWTDVHLSMGWWPRVAPR